MKSESRVIKQADDKESDLSALAELKNDPMLSSDVKKKIDQEIRNIRAGFAAEKRAGYLLSQFVEASNTAYIINDLRLEHEGNVCQIDHVTINRFGVIRLFETKSFSTGIKIDENGAFLRWDAHRKCYAEIPSPIKQSKRHELVLRQVLEELGYSIVAMEHYVLVDYKARLIKPDEGFENVCRPDAVDDALTSSADKLSALGVLKRAFQMQKTKISDEKCKEVVRALADMHKPISVNYREKFGINKQVVDQSYDRLTTAKTAQRLGMSTKALNAELERKGYMRRQGANLYLTDKGRSKGVIFRRGKHAYYFLFPLDFCL